MYLYGWRDWQAWLFPIPTALGLYGIDRLQDFGQDDQWSWLLIPLLGLTLAACALQAILIGLTSAEKWDLEFHAGDPSVEPGGKTTWLTVAAVVASLLMGTTILMASLAFGFQRYFEYQIEAARLLSQ